MEQAARHLPPHPRPLVEGTPPGAAAYDDDDDDDDDPVGGRQAELRVVFFYERMSTTYFLQNLILIPIVSCVFSSWAIHFQDVAGRLGVDVTLLLAVSFTQASTASRRWSTT